MKFLEPRPSDFLTEQFGGCDCSLGLPVCDCRQACQRADQDEEETPDDLSWKWAGRAILAICVVCLWLAARGIFK